MKAWNARAILCAAIRNVSNGTGYVSNFPRARYFFFFVSYRRCIFFNKFLDVFTFISIMMICFCFLCAMQCNALVYIRPTDPYPWLSLPPDMLHMFPKPLSHSAFVREQMAQRTFSRRMQEERKRSQDSAQGLGVGFIRRSGGDGTSLHDESNPDDLESREDTGDGFEGSGGYRRGGRGGYDPGYRGGRGGRGGYKGRNFDPNFGKYKWSDAASRMGDSVGGTGGTESAAGGSDSRNNERNRDYHRGRNHSRDRNGDDVDRHYSHGHKRRSRDRGDAADQPPGPVVDDLEAWNGIITKPR